MVQRLFLSANLHGERNKFNEHAVFKKEMRALGKYWLTEPAFDFEYKKYKLLGWFQQVEKHFRGQRLFPALDVVMAEYKTMRNLHRERTELHQQFRRRLIQADPARLRLQWEELPENPEVWNELDQVIKYAIPLLHEACEEGDKLSRAARADLKLVPIGLTPLRLQEGYLLVPQAKHTLVYRYALRPVTAWSEHLSFKQVRLKADGKYPLSLDMAPENIKRDLIRRQPELPNPATYLLESKAHWPLQHTMLPLARGLIYRLAAA